MEMTGAGSSILSTYSFDAFDDDVSKDGHDLTGDAEYSASENGGLLGSGNHAATASASSVAPATTRTVLTNPTLITDISQVQLLEQDSQPPTELLESPLHEGLQKKNKGGWPKGKKRKAPRLRDENAPRQPLTGYVRFMNERREKIRTDNPGLPFAEVTKAVASEWSKLSSGDKKKYLDEAERDKEQYLKQLEAYQQTETFKIFQKKKKIVEREQQQQSVLSLEDRSSPLPTLTQSAGVEETPVSVKEFPHLPGLDVPIFTEEFLEHNKAREAELRELRKQNTRFEEQNAILSKHIEDLRGAIDRLETEATRQRTTNSALQIHLDQLRSTLATSFASLALPASSELPTVETIDTYMVKLHQIILEAPHEHEALIASVREILSRLHLDR